MLSAITSHVLTSERTVKLNYMRDTSRNAPTLKKIEHLLNNIEIQIHVPLVTSLLTMSIHHQSKSHFKTLTEGKNKFSRHLEQLSSSSGRVLGITTDIFKAGKSEYNTTLDNVLFYATTKVNSPKT